jgi:hypothetical protein
MVMIEIGLTMTYYQKGKRDVHFDHWLFRVVIFNHGDRA